MTLLADAGPYTLSRQWEVDGTVTDVGTVTVGILDGNGDITVAAGTVTVKTGSGTTTTYSYTLASVADPDQLRVTWTRTDTSAFLTDPVEVVGAWLFTEREARSFAAKADATSALIPLADAAEYPDAQIAEGRTDITDDLEYWTGRGWVPRYARLEFSGNGSPVLYLRSGQCRTSDGKPLKRPAHTSDVSQILTVTDNGATVPAGEVKIDTIGECLIRTVGVWSPYTQANPFNIIVEYVYGMPYPVDGVNRIALKLLVDRLVPSAWPDRMISADTEFGTTRFVLPGGPMNNVSRIPEVNEWVTRHNHQVLVG